MSDITERLKPYQIADSLLKMAQDVEIGHANRLGVPAASFLRESADCISRQNDEIERLKAALREIEKTPAWGAPDRWETTPAEVRQLARRALEAKDD